MRNHELIEQLQQFNQMANTLFRYKDKVLRIKAIFPVVPTSNPQLSLDNIIDLDDPDARFEAEADVILKTPDLISVTRHMGMNPQRSHRMPREVFDQLVKDADARDAREAQQKAAEAARVAVPNGVAALHFFLMVELKRCYHNRMRAEWDTTTDPGIDGISWRPKWTGFPSKHDPNRFEPRFQFEDVQLWFDEPGRSTKANKALTGDEWIAWFDRCHAHIIKWGDSPRQNDDEDDFDDFGL